MRKLYGIGEALIDFIQMLRTLNLKMLNSLVGRLEVHG